MGRVAQPKGQRGSLKWIQAAIQHAPECLQPHELESIDWLSPHPDDDYAEYRDGAFLELLGLGHLGPELRKFWPPRGPQWDALGKAGETVILVEAKAHLEEFFSPGTQASVDSRRLIVSSLASTKTALGARDVSDWSQIFYQYANRIAHLNWLIENEISARLLLVSFIGDRDINGPSSAESWKAAYKTADHALGIPSRHKLSKYILHVHPDVNYIPD